MTFFFVEKMKSHCLGLAKTLIFTKIVVFCFLTNVLGPFRRKHKYSTVVNFVFFDFPGFFVVSLRNFGQLESTLSPGFFEGEC